MNANTRTLAVEDVAGIGCAAAQVPATKDEDRVKLWIGADAAKAGADVVVAVFDGHGGPYSADLMCEQLLDAVAERLRVRGVANGKTNLTQAWSSNELWESPDDSARGGSAAVASLLDYAMTGAFNKLDTLGRAARRGGTTATVLVLKRTSQGTHVKVYWCGDSRAAVRLRRLGNLEDAVDVSVDHLPDNRAEATRIADFYANEQRTRHGVDVAEMAEELGRNPVRIAPEREEEGPTVGVQPDPQYLSLVQEEADKLSIGSSFSDGESSREGSHHGQNYAKLALATASQVTPQKTKYKPTSTASPRRHLEATESQKAHRRNDLLQEMRMRYPMSFVGYFTNAKTGEKISKPRVYSSMGGASLGMTRSIGDAFAARGIISDPEIEYLFIPNDSAAARFIVCTDGVWDVISTLKAGRISSLCKSPTDAALRLAQTASKERSLCGKVPDDVTAAIIDVGRPIAPKPKGCSCF